MASLHGIASDFHLEKRGPVLHENDYGRSKTAATEQQAKRNARACGPRTKPGCLTCKMRRTKCDEAKPGCTQCARRGIVCPGYPRPAKLSRSFQDRKATGSQGSRETVKCAKVTSQAQNTKESGFAVVRPSQENTNLCRTSVKEPSQRLKYDVWNKPSPPMAIPGNSASNASGRVGVSTSMLESTDALLSRSLLEQCRLEESPGSISPRSSDATWKSRWWSDAMPSTKTSLSTWDSSVGQSQTVESHDLEDHENPAQEDPKFVKEQTATQRCWSHVSALSAMLGSVQGPEPLCPPKHDIWALMATARKFQPCMGKLGRCSGQGNRKPQSCPNPRTQRILDEVALSPSSASKPVAIPASKSPLGRPVRAGESTDTSYTSSDQTAAMKTSCSSSSSPGLLSCEERKRALLDRLMEYFFAELARGRTNAGGRAGCSTGPGTNSTAGSSSRQGAGPQDGLSRKGKRPASSDEHGGSDNEGNDAPKPKKAKSEETEVKRLACPFFKRNPRRYKDQSKCVGPGWLTVHRLKEHLYRRHMLPIHCYRCREIFTNDRLLQLHSRSKQQCAVRDDLSGEQELQGIDAHQERLLRSRKRTDRSEGDKWCDVFRICFPADAPDSIPTPWFELPPAWGGELGGHTPGSPPTDFARYEEFLRRELPRRVRGELEVRIEHELSPVEESLKHQLVDIVRDMQQRLFADFRKMQGDGASHTEGITGNEELGEDDGGDAKGKGRATALESPEELAVETSNSGASFDDSIHETPPTTADWATTQPIDVYRQSQQFLDGVANFNGVMFDLGQSCGDWSWADSGYMSAAMSAASSKAIADDDNMLCDDATMGGQFGHPGIYGDYRDNWL